MNNKLDFKWSDRTARQVAGQCKQTETGARNIDYIIDMNILPKISKMILKRMASADPISEICLGVDEDGHFSVEFI